MANGALRTPGQKDSGQNNDEEGSYRHPISPDLGPGHDRAAGNPSDPRGHDAAAGNPSDPRGDSLDSVRQNENSGSLYNPRGDSGSTLKSREESGDDTVGSGYSDDAKPKRAPGRFRITRRRGAVIGASTITTLLIGAFISFSTGPLRIIHYAQLLGKSFSHQDDANSTRIGRIIRWVKTGDVGETRIGYITSKELLPRIKANFADEGIKMNMSKRGYLDSLNIDTSRNQKYKNLSESDARAAIAADHGMKVSDVTVAPDNTWQVPLKNLSISDQRSVLKAYVKEKNLGWLASKIYFRVLSKYVGVPGWLHPINRLSAEADQRLLNKVKFPDAIKDYLKQRTEPITARSDAAKAKIAEVRDKLGTSGKIVSGALIGSTAICVAKDVAHDIPGINRAVVVVPAMASAGDAMALGSQFESGQDLTAAEAGAITSGLTDSSGKSVWDSAAIRSLNGGSGGEDINPDVKQAFSPDSTAANIEQTLNDAGADGLCSTFGQIVQGVIGVGLLALGPGGWIVKGFTAIAGTVATGAVIQGIETLVPKLIADQPITGTPHEGPNGGSVDAYGARELNNTESRTFGGTAISGTTSAMLDKQQTLADNKQFQSESLAKRIFDTHDYRSLASRVIDSQNPNVPQDTASLIAKFTSIGNLFRSFASIFSHASADTKPYDYGFPETIIDERLLNKSDQALVDNSRTNADTVAQLLDNPSAGQPYIDKAMTCFGVQIAKSPDGLWDAVPKQDVNPSSADYTSANCGDKSDKNWLRVTYFVWDTGLMESWACDNGGDDQACADSGFGASASSPTTTPTTTAGTTIDMAHLYDDSTSVACAANTNDLGVHDGYTNGKVVRIRLCAISNLPSSGEEANGGYGVSGANGKCPLNSRVSGTVYAMVQAAQQAGVNLATNSCFRTMSHQEALCPCDGVHVARPGYSNHQMGLAMDFSTLPFSPGPVAGNPVWDWLSKNAANFGYKNYPAEAWHWSPTGN